MNIEQYKKEHADPKRWHWVVFQTNSGEKYLLTPDEVIGKPGEEWDALEDLSERAYQKYEGPWNGSPIAYLVNELESSGLGKIIEKHYDFNYQGE